jgi:hypothetical protein
MLNCQIEKDAHQFSRERRRGAFVGAGVHGFWPAPPRRWDHQPQHWSCQGPDLAIFLFFQSVSQRLGVETPESLVVFRRSILRLPSGSSYFGPPPT